MRVLSLFDGMSCGLQALKQANIPVTQYYASEIDKYAIKISSKNHPEIIQLGEVINVRKMAETGSLGKIDLLIGGSPCQGFSFAGKQLAFDDPRSVLFFEWVKTLKALQKTNPNIKFLLENVRMKKEHLDIISEQLGVSPILINSSLLSAQNRQRYYWANWKITQPQDRSILLKDIIEHGVSENFNLSNKLVNGLKNGSPAFKGRFKPHTAETKKSYCLTARYYKMGKTDPYIEMQGGAIRGRYNEDGTTSQQLELNNQEKANCITSVQKDSLLVNPDISWRKLTPVECERLQTLPDNYTEDVSNTQRYKMLGNGWTVAVVEHIFSEMKNES